MTLDSIFKGTLWYRRVKTLKNGTVVMRRRTARGREQMTWNWMQRHPHLFTADAIRTMKHVRGKPHARQRCWACKDPSAYREYFAWIRSARSDR